MANFDWAVRPNLTIKLIAIILMVSLGNSVLIMRHAEEQLEEAILDQVKKQAYVFLQEVSKRIQNQNLATDSLEIATILRDAKGKAQRQEFDFSVKSIYIYDREGKILTHTEPGHHEVKSLLNNKYGGVLQSGSPFIGDKVETEQDPILGTDHHVLDIILPIFWKDQVIGGLEAELDMDETMLRIGQADDRYETQLAWVLAIHGLLMAIILWVIINRILVRPVRLLDDVAVAIAEGDLSSRFTAKQSKDEIGRLSGSVNHMADNIETLIKEQEEAYMQAMRSLMQALEVKDEYTAIHSSRVSKYSVMLGKKLGLSEEKLELLKKGALMHDLGKVGIPDAILNKPSGLDDDEFIAMRTHPVHTAIIMKPLKRFKEFAEIAAWHHERWDGKGYPDGLKGEEVPLLARIVSIADTWDAMTGDRVYRKGMPKEKALGILVTEKDSGQWDPNLIKIFVDMVKE